jgi:hypothetical protein
MSVETMFICAWRYLSRYVNKTAVSDNRLKKIENGNVHLSCIDRKSKTAKVEIISEELFLKRLVLHILPKGFKNIRFYGFMANRCRKSLLSLCRVLLGIPLAEQVEIEDITDTAFLFWKYFRVDITLCSACGKGHLTFVKTNKRCG